MISNISPNTIEPKKKKVFRVARVAPSYATEGTFAKIPARNIEKIPPNTTTLTLHLSNALFESLKKLSEEQKISINSLTTIYIKERIDKELSPYKGKKPKKTKTQPASLPSSNGEHQPEEITSTESNTSVEEAPITE
ncbi:MAG: hypothetical protein KGZ58_09005 [Ignavibacteriales bacterium]|nr:hypothetical protein [Ignavibacteriales bacterium]